MDSALLLLEECVVLDSVRKVKFKLCDQNQAAEGIVISYFSQREIHI